jgi:hypothetical protein
VTNDPATRFAALTAARRRREPLTLLADVRKEHNLVGAFDSVRAARAVIESLENAGVDGSDISLLGAHLADGPADEAPAAGDSPVTKVGRNVVVGTVAGGAAGAALGVAALDVSTISAALLGLVMGAALGGLIGAFAGVGIATAWRNTFRPLQRGNIAVGVHSTDPAAISVALDVMETYSPLAVNQFTG